MNEAEKVWEACCASENGEPGPDSVVIIAQALREARAEGMREAAKLCQLEVERYLAYPHCPEHAASASGCAKRIMELSEKDRCPHDVHGSDCFRCYPPPPSTL